MSLQNLFYSFAIIYLILGIIFIVTLTAIVLKIYATARKTPDNVKDYIKGLLGENKTKIFGIVGMAFASFLATKFKKMWGK